ncbi:50S ribosomal protein L11 methyltransferase [Marinirhabdus gelatinilytica]|uniref:Ribosomal protein L11 methyltransferase n=1 Tax=Marinirhabdus gelatinilytica TaxID=1703343 RepID=A0A370Q9I7_9FLAO|nr:50S ribosomal protein L11 methyltransferase [Marinirhabdus gelatinilytica]RDK84710.1 ribosomal protein L11 methyltransferase [Marinirhabdus gelatinilytica]
MPSTYIEYTFKVTPLQPGTEILIAELGQAGFESFVENEEGVQAYIQKEDWHEAILDPLFILKSSEFEVTFQQQEIAQINWNQEWEKNFTPIVVGDACAVRAPFHKPFNVPYEIVIEPKMSFGTGHHETTFMMLQHILGTDCQGKKVLDMGCGTAVLAILAEMKGARALDAIDIDEWCVENSNENLQRNKCSRTTTILGGVEAIPTSEKYDIIIANINRNILLDQMETYASVLGVGGQLFLSGFYREDLPLITDCCNKLGLDFVQKKEKNNWIAAKFVN